MRDNGPREHKEGSVGTRLLDRSIRSGYGEHDYFSINLA